jgi:hypothetical protein
VDAGSEYGGMWMDCGNLEMGWRGTTAGLAVVSMEKKDQRWHLRTQPG